MTSTPSSVEKAELRSRILVGRRSRSTDQRVHEGAEIAATLLAQPEVAGARTVAAYASVGTEPPTDGLLGVLLDRGCRVLLPLLLPDLDLDWAEYAGPDALIAGPRGMSQPAGPGLGRGAVGDVDALVCPGLAVDRTGLRLGRGGGSYDRVLARSSADVWRCVLLYADEVLGVDLPAEAHDQRVHAAATPRGLVRFHR